MKKRISGVLAVLMMLQMLPQAFANDVFDLQRVLVTDDNKIKIEFNEKVADDSLDAIYFYNEKSEKVSANAAVSAEDDKAVVLNFPTSLQNQSVQLLVGNGVKSEDGTALADVYMYNVAQSAINEDFSKTPDWKYIYIGNMTVGTEIVNSYTDLSVPDGKLTRSSFEKYDESGKKLTTYEGVAVPKADLTAMTSTKSTIEFTLKPDKGSNPPQSTSSPCIYVNLSKIKRPSDGEYTNSKWQLTPNGYGISLNWGNLILHKFTYENAADQSISGGASYANHTHSFAYGYGYADYRVRIVTTNSADSVKIEVVLAEIDSNGNWDFTKAKATNVYEDKNPISTTGGFGISGWGTGNTWSIDDFQYVAQLTVSGEQKASTYKIEAERKIAEVLGATGEPADLQQTVIEVNALITKLKSFGLSESDVEGYGDFVEKCEALMRFELIEAYRDEKNADVMVLKFNHPVKESEVENSIYVATDDREKLDADVSVNSTDKTEIKIRIPVDFADKEASIVVKPTFTDENGTEIYEGKVVRMSFVKKYDDFTKGDTENWMSVTTSQAEKDFDKLVQSPKTISIDNGCFKDNGWLFDTSYKNNTFTDTIIETDFKAVHENMSGLTLFSRMGGLTSKDWAYYGNSYIVAWWGQSVWFSKTPNAEQKSINNSISYNNKILIKSGPFTCKPNIWYSLRFVTTTLKDGSVKLDLYIVEKGNKFTDPVLTYIDSNNPLTNAGISSFKVDKQTVNGQSIDSFSLDYYSISSDAKVTKIYSISEVKKALEDKISHMSGKTLTDADRAEVDFMGNTVEFLKTCGVETSAIEGYGDFVTMKEMYPFVTKADFVQATEDFTIKMEFSHDMDMGKVSDYIKIYKDSEEASDYTVTADGKKLSIKLYNDRNYDSEYKVVIDGAFAAKNNLSIGDEYTKSFNEKAPISVTAPTVTKNSGKIKVSTTLTSAADKECSLLVALMTKDKDSNGKEFYKTEALKLVPCDLKANVPFTPSNLEFAETDAKSGSYIYTALYEGETGLDLIYKEQTAVLE